MARKTKPKKNRGGFPVAEPPKNQNPPADLSKRPMRWDLVVIFLVIAIGGTYFAIWIRPDMSAQQFTFEVTAEYPHDESAFTQGIYLEDDILWESTGRYGQSTIRRTDLKTGEILQKVDLPPELFGEGLTIWNDQLVQLTWKKGIALFYDRELNKIKEMSFEDPEKRLTDGWGLTHDDKHLIVSDGTPTIHFLDPETLKEVRSIRVRDKRRSIGQLNELEYVNDKIYANQLGVDRILEINPVNGAVEAIIDLTGLWPQAERKSTECVLNGIAFNPKTKRLLVTGKLCPKIWEVRLELKEEK